MDCKGDFIRGEVYFYPNKISIITYENLSEIEKIRNTKIFMIKYYTNNTNFVIFILDTI